MEPCQWYLYTQAGRHFMLCSSKWLYKDATAYRDTLSSDTVLIHNNLRRSYRYRDTLMYENVYLYIATTDAVVHYDCKFVKYHFTS